MRTRVRALSAYAGNIITKFYKERRAAQTIVKTRWENLIHEADFLSEQLKIGKKIIRQSVSFAPTDCLL